MRTAAASAAIGLVVALEACGSGAAGPCTDRARAVVAQTAAVSPSSLRAVAVRPADGTIACRMTAGSQLRVLADVDSSPQPFFRLERASIEASQNVLWSHQSTALYPSDVQGIGLEATWFPASDQLMTTDGVRLITVTVAWDGAPRSRKASLAEALARAYLGSSRKPRFAGNS